MGGLEFSKNQKLALIAIVGLILIGVSIKLARNANSSRYEGVVFKEAESDGVGVVTSGSDPMQSSANSSGKVVFQVAGCVKSPDVYTLPTGSRIIDGIRAAGGVKSDASVQSLNLAARIDDGARIYVPSRQESAASASSASTQNGAANSSGGKSSSSAEKLRNPGDGTVNINRASESDMQRLPGVGPSTAAKIIEFRGQIGHFTSVDQLDEVKGIGPKKLQKMRPFISL